MNQRNKNIDANNIQNNYPIFYGGFNNQNNLNNQIGAHNNLNIMAGFINIQNNPHNTDPYNNQLGIHSQNPNQNSTINNFIN